jgi:tetratricopeptide (TPR) repeat protein
MNFIPRIATGMLILSTWSIFATEAIGQDIAGSPELKGVPAEIAKGILEANKAAKNEKAIDNKDPLSSGLIFLDHLGGDLDFECKLRLRYVKILLAEDRLLEAEKLVRTIADYRSAIGELLVLEQRIVKGDNKDAVLILRKVESDLGRWKDWQMDIVKKQLASVGALAGMGESDLAAWLTGYELESDRMGAVALAQVQRVCRGARFDLVEMKKNLSEGFESVKGLPVPEMVEAASKLFVYATRQVAIHGNQEDTGKFFDGVGWLLEHSNAYHADLLLDMSRFWVQQDKEEEAKVTFEKAFGQLGFHLEGGGERYFKMVEIWKLRAKEQALGSYLEKLEGVARSQQPMDQPGALAWLGACYSKMGKEGKANELFMEAVQIASVNPNHRMRHRGCIEVCLCHARLDRELSPELTIALESVLRGEALVLNGANND